MYSQFLAQATHNQKFLDCIESNFPDDFHDWKMSVMFYISIHLLKEMAEQYHVDIGRTHEETANILDPDRNKNPPLIIPNKVWRCYRHLYRYSKQYRYDGYWDTEVILEARLTDYNAAKSALSKICSFMCDEQKIVH